MALNPTTEFPGQVAAPTAGYPYSSAQNVTVANDGTGTPWRARLLNDIWGLLQSLLDEASIVPDGEPDEVGASQYLEALQALFVLGQFGVADAEVQTNLQNRAEYQALEPDLANYTQLGTFFARNMDANSPNQLELGSGFTSGVTYTVGPTGSGLDIIWDDLDDLPSDTTAVEIAFVVGTDNNFTGTALTIFADTAPAGSVIGPGQATRYGQMKVEADTTTQIQYRGQATIRLGADKELSHEFTLIQGAGAGTAGASIQWYIRGYYR